MKQKKSPLSRLLIVLSVVFLVISSVGLYMDSQYIKDNLMQSGQAMATDIALLVKNNFEITDDEVIYMKALTFNEMEVDPINQRLMDVGNGVVLSAEITNVYLLSPLAENEYRYCTDEESADFLGFSLDTALDEVWLLNGKINEDGVFEVAQRDDIFRYTAMDESQLRGMEQREAFGTFTTDAWGSFITGYAPIYTVEGNFVGLLGIDMDPDPYQSSAQHMILLIIILFAIIIVLFCVLSILFFLKYAKAKELERQFVFFSDMSHEMRTPLNGILGMAELSKNETDVSVLHHNFEQVENSGKHLLKLVNHTLDYKNNDNTDTVEETVSEQKTDTNWPMLSGKKVLLCEDQLINSEITRKMLENVGCVMELAQDGQQGLNMFSASPVGYYDAILMDIRMPVMDGNEAARSIRALQREDAKRVPIIAVTANSFEEDRKKTKASGMNEHLTKPLNPNDLYSALSLLLSPESTNEQEEPQ